MAFAVTHLKKSIAVVGGGPAGLIAAATLAVHGFSVDVILPEDRSDPRTVALMQPSLRLLERIGVWPGTLQSKCAALKHLDIIDDTDNIVSAPRLTFSASELGLDAFGWNVPLVELLPAVRDRLRQLDVRIHHGSVASVELGDTCAHLTLEQATTINAELVLACDGAESKLRGTAGIETTSWSFDQHALVCNFTHTADHQGVSTERHLVGGLCTTVPLPGRRSALVWMGKPSEIKAFIADPARLAQHIQLLTKGTLGLISDVSPPKSFPMRGLSAKRFAAQRIMLLGEAAHAMPPIGAQGLNMSMRDIGHVLEVLQSHDDPGTVSAMQDYHMRRVRDVTERQGAVSMINHTLIADVLPLNLLRVGAFAAISSIPPLRQNVIRTGLFPDAVLPEFMKQRADTAIHKQELESSVH